MDDILKRAFAAYFRSGGNLQPSNGSTLREVKGKNYAVLCNTNGILVVYRVKNNGALKSLKRPPSEIVEEFQG